MVGGSWDLGGGCLDPGCVAAERWGGAARGSAALRDGRAPRPGWGGRKLNLDPLPRLLLLTMAAAWLPPVAGRRRNQGLPVLGIRVGRVRQDFRGMGMRSEPASG